MITGNEEARVLLIDTAIATLKQSNAEITPQNVWMIVDQLGSDYVSPEYIAQRIKVFQEEQGML